MKLIGILAAAFGTIITIVYLYGLDNNTPLSSHRVLGWGDAGPQCDGSTCPDLHCQVATVLMDYYALEATRLSDSSPDATSKDVYARWRSCGDPEHGLPFEPMPVGMEVVGGVNEVAWQSGWQKTDIWIARVDKATDPTDDAPFDCACGPGCRMPDGGATVGSHVILPSWTSPDAGECRRVPCAAMQGDPPESMVAVCCADECTGRTCGAGRCGSSCGTCASGQVCRGYSCAPSDPTVHAACWNNCSVYASGWGICQGGPASVTRSGTSTCTCAGGTVLTAQPNQLCATEYGAKLSTTTVATLPAPSSALSTSGPISVFLEATAPSWYLPTTALLSIGNITGEGSLALYLTQDGAAPQFYCTVYDSASASRYTRVAIPQNAAGTSSGISTHFFGCQYNGSGYPIAYIDQMPRMSLQGGAGSGTLAQAALSRVFNIGAWPAAAANKFDGTVKNVTACASMMEECTSKRALRDPVTRTKKILFIGDSIAYGTGSTSGGPATASLVTLLASLGSPWEGVNAGIGGQWTTLIRTRWEQQFKLSYFSDVIVEGGLNDCGAANIPIPTIKDNLRAIYDGAIASGARAVATTVTPTNAVALQPCIEEVNAWIRLQPDVTVADTWAALVGADGHGLKTEYNTDGTHPNQAGHDAIAARIYSVGW